MTASICGADCAACPSAGECGGCRETGGRPFRGGECILAACCRRRGQQDCAPCGAACALKALLIEEFNALGIPDLPKVTDLNALPGAYINLPFTLPNGQTAKLLENEKIYLGNQVEKPGGGRCYGLAADGNFLLVCEYGAEGANPEIVLYKKRKQCILPAGLPKK